MRKIIFGSACLIGGLLLVLIMLFIGEYPNAFGGLNLFGKVLVWLGVIASVGSFVFCLGNLRDGE